MTKFYRSVGDAELFQIFLTGKVMPKPFGANCDSTIPSGNWSFWCDRPTEFSPTPCAIVSGEFEPVRQGRMTASMGDGHGNVYHLSCDEYVTDQAVDVVDLWICDIHRDFIVEKDDLDLRLYLEGHCGVENAWAEGFDELLPKFREFHDTAEIHPSEWFDERHAWKTLDCLVEWDAKPWERD